MNEAEFWEWVSSEVKATKSPKATKKSLMDFIEEELKGAEDGIKKALIAGNEKGKAYWEGYADALKTIKNAIEKGEVRVWAFSATSGMTGRS